MFVRVTPSQNDSLAAAVEEMIRKSGAKPSAPARKCVVVAFDDEGQPDYLITDELQDAAFARQCAAREAAADPGRTYAVFQIVSTTVAAVSPPVTTPA